MGFLIRMAFWFSLVLLALPLDPVGGASGVSPIQAFFAARAAVDDISGICERKPDVCDVGRAAMQTIGVRAKESARIAYEMLEENGVPAKQQAASAGALLAADVDVSDQPRRSTDSVATGSVKPAS
ncbi:MAG: DUF5330 domain-containing protein [Hyphomicrobiales bacterium]|nr:DUF5330 domain-containing protein [Hyphomicrobiales bacterium]